MELGREILEILNDDRSYKYIKELDKINKLKEIFPEIEPMKEVGECKYHVLNCYDHSVYVLKTLERLLHSEDFLERHIQVYNREHLYEVIEGDIKRIQLIKLGALFHDVGKPLARTVDETGRVRFKKHEVIGADIIVNIGKRLGLGDKSISILYNYVRYHMWPLYLYKHNDMSSENLFKMFNETQNESVDISLIGYADIVATRKLLNPDEDMGLIKTFMEYTSTNYIFRYKECENIDDVLDNNIDDDTKYAVRKAIFSGKVPKDKERIKNYIKA
ncbi:MAG TPA: HD domain-containing protein [Peptostreptococcaceae bacterium]|nr:HD domain-containing protein [Peptostreptococcaceae bacterium]